MKMIVGLGNPGSKYTQTKHNIGFITVDEIAQQLGVRFNQAQFEADYCECFVAGEKILLVKPVTYMNESGRAVEAISHYYNIGPEDILVIYDDLDLAVGAVRLRAQGGAGGHNGIKSLLQCLGTPAFNRIRIGIGRPIGRQDVVSHVLSPFPKDTHEAMYQAVKQAAEASLFWSEGHTFIDTMNHFNGKK